MSIRPVQNMETHTSAASGARALLAAAIGIVLLVTLSPDGTERSPARVHLLADIRDYLVGGDALAILVQLGGNIALFVPVGLLAPLTFRALDSPGRTALAAAALSVAVETAQYLAPIGRTASIDDVLLNTIGGIAGYLLLRAVQHATTDPSR